MLERGKQDSNHRKLCTVTHGLDFILWVMGT